MTHHVDRRSDATALAPARAGTLELLLDRWPTALGLTLGLLTAVDLTLDRSMLGGVAGLTIVMALVYVGAATLHNRRAAWPILLVGLPVLVVPDPVRPYAIGALVAATVGFVTYGAIRLRGRDTSDVALTGAAAVVVTGLCLAAVAADRLSIAATLVAVALLAHATWDLYHLRRDQVVSRSYAEFCWLFDAIVGIGILLAI